MIFELLGPEGLYKIAPDKLEDARGFFARVFCAEEFATVGIDVAWVQMNSVVNVQRGTLRGLHFQRPPLADAKLVRCVRGAIFDVVVDIRDGSDTYGQATCVELTGDNRAMLYVPPGFAHGYQALTAEVEMLYLHSRAYSPEHEGGLAWDDPALGIDWPLAAVEVSARDKAHPTLADLERVRL
jgi:dTDP-4-dehydrorhamnose 3,5-epimerase